MKKIISLFVLLILSAWPLACTNRALTQPVNPAFAPTPTQTWVYPNAPTPTPTP